MAWWSRAQNIIGTRWLIFSSMYILLLSPTPQSSSLCLVLIWEVVRRNATSVPERQGINTEKSYASDLPSRCGWDLQRHLVFRKSDPEQARVLWTRKIGPGCKYVCTTDCLAPWQGKPHPKQSSPVECCFPHATYVCSLLYAGVREARIVMGLTTQNMTSPYRVPTRGCLSP